MFFVTTERDECSEHCRVIDGHELSIGGRGARASQFLLILRVQFNRVIASVILPFELAHELPLFFAHSSNSILS